MRCTEQAKILTALPGRRHTVAARDANSLIKLETAFATPFQVDATIFPREREISRPRNTLVDLRQQRLPEPLCFFPLS